MIERKIQTIPISCIILSIKASVLDKIANESMRMIFAELKIMVQRFARKWLQLEIEEFDSMIWEVSE